MSRSRFGRHLQVVLRRNVSFLAPLIRQRIILWFEIGREVRARSVMSHSGHGRHSATLEQPTRLQILKGGSPLSVNYLYRTDSISGACGGNKARYART